MINCWRRKLNNLFVAREETESVRSVAFARNAICRYLLYSKEPTWLCGVPFSFHWYTFSNRHGCECLSTFLRLVYKYGDNVLFCSINFFFSLSCVFFFFTCFSFYIIISLHKQCLVVLPSPHVCLPSIPLIESRKAIVPASHLRTANGSIARRQDAKH